jgi:hypothetical protein
VTFPPGSEAERATTSCEVLILVIEAVMVELSDVTTQTGAANSVAEKGSVHEVTVPVPSVIVPTVSVPATLGLVPHDVGVPGVPAEPTGLYLSATPSSG